MEQHTVAVIGGGPGGYVAAIRLNQYGVDTVVFEENRLGGVCLNWGCIPTKSMVKVAEVCNEINKGKQYGLQVENLSINYERVKKRKDKIVDKLVSGVEFIFKKRKIPVVNAKVEKIARKNDKYVIESGEKSIACDYVIIATGSKPKELDNLKIDNINIFSSRGILELEELPDHLTIVGGGVIGCEFASIFSNLGTKVEIVEFLPNLVDTEDKEISRRFALSLKKQRVKLHLNTAVEDYQKQDKLILKLSNGKEIKTDKVLLSVGREPNFNFELDNIKIDRKNNYIKIDNAMKTKEKNIFAIGDITGKLMLAHTASKQGTVVASIIKQLENHEHPDNEAINYKNIPRCTYTQEEIGSIGLTTSEAKEKFGEIKIGKFPFAANGKSLSIGNNFGFVKVIIAKNKIVGMHIIGPHATELIAQGSILINKEYSEKELKNIVMAHPTLSEAVYEAIEDVEGLAIHKI